METETKRQSNLRINTLKHKILTVLQSDDSNELEMVLALTSITKVIIEGEVNGFNRTKAK